MEWISRIEERAAEITQPEQIKKRDREWERKNVFNEDSLRELWDNIKDTDSHSIGVPEREERKGQKIIWRNIGWWEFPGSPVITTYHFHFYVAQVQSLVGELRSHKSCCAAPKKVAENFPKLEKETNIHV